MCTRLVGITSVWADIPVICPKTVSRTASNLVSIGLMDVTIIDDGRLKKIYKLTPKGEKVAMHLMQAKLEFEETVIDMGNPCQNE